MVIIISLSIIISSTINAYAIYNFEDQGEEYSIDYQNISSESSDKETDFTIPEIYRSEMINAVKLKSRGALATLAAAIIVEVVLSSGSYLGYRVWEVMDNNKVQNGWVSESRIFSAPVWAYKRSGKWTYGWSNISNEWYYFNSHRWMYSSRYKVRRKWILHSG